MPSATATSARRWSGWSTSPSRASSLTNERLYELLTLGTSLTQTIDGDRKSFSLHYIDWQHPERNVYHVTDEFAVEKRGSHSTRRPDIVLFVNGIPLVVIECKRADKDHHGEKAVALGIEQLLIYQREDEIPHLFAYSQLLWPSAPTTRSTAPRARPRSSGRCGGRRRARIFLEALRRFRRFGVNSFQEDGGGAPCAHQPAAGAGD